MDQDDPEKRIADLENQLAGESRGADLPPAQPPRPMNATKRTASGRRSSRNVVAAIGAAVFALIGLSYGANDVLGYSRGTPTIATIISCDPRNTCYGTWSIDGVSQDGLIERGFRKPAVGSTVDVRVRDGRAFLAGAWFPSLAFGGFFLAGSIFALVGGRSRKGRG
jgi:hypothetical protein